MLSFVVPAHNEQACLGRTVQAIHAAARATGRPYEVIVVDDASTDATAEVARKHDATVVSVNRRQIAASVTDQPTKQGLLDLAGRYEAVAREDEGLDAFPDRDL